MGQQIYNEACGNEPTLVRGGRELYRKGELPGEG
jgi:hypothetical protein